MDDSAPQQTMATGSIDRMNHDANAKLLDDAPPPDALFPRVLGEAFARLPLSVRRFHLAPGRWRGEAEVERGDGVLSRLFALLTQLPPRGHHPVQVEVCEIGDGERWSRRYGDGHTMRSRLWCHDGRLRERLGPILFEYAMHADAEALVWRVDRVRALGLPLPVRWFAGVVARETSREGRYRFDVRAEMPWIGLLVHYRGGLDSSAVEEAT